MPREFVTVFSDASFDPHSGVAAWGGWAKSNRGRVYHSGRFRENPPTVNAAELQAGANAMRMAINGAVICRGDKVLLQMDSMHAINVVRGNLRPQGEAETKALWWLTKTCAEMDLVLICRHVKGHCNDGSKRAWVNSFVDRSAGAHMRLARAKENRRG